MEDNEDKKKQLEEKICNLTPSGKPLLDYMKSLPKEELEEYISYLVACDMTKLLKIGERYFYLVHGATALRGKDDVEWEGNLVLPMIDVRHNYKKEMESDPIVKKEKDWRFEDTIILCGGMSSFTVVENTPEMRGEYFESRYSEYQRVALVNNKMLIHCGCQMDEYEDRRFIPTLACVEINPTGYEEAFPKKQYPFTGLHRMRKNIYLKNTGRFIGGSLLYCGFLPDHRSKL